METATKGGKKADHFKTAKTLGSRSATNLLARVDSRVKIKEQERRYTGLLKPFLKARAEQPNKGAQDTSEQPLTDKEEESK